MLNRQTRLSALVAVLFLCAFCPAVAVEYGMVQGTVKYTDGLPSGVVKFTLQVGGTTVPMVTGYDGAFSGVVPAGKAVILINGLRLVKTLTAGQTTPLHLKVTRPGWVISFRFRDKRLAHLTTIAVEYKSPAKRQADQPGSVPGARRIGAEALDAGRYWLPKIPAETTALAVVGLASDNGVHIPVRQQWYFTDKASQRQLTVTLEPGVPVRIALVGQDGMPMANSTVHGSLSFQAVTTSIGNRCWDSRAFSQTAASKNIPAVSTDAEGIFSLGLLPPGQYELVLRNDETGGAPTVFTVKRDGTVSLAKYALNLTVRTVTQTVFSPAGTPVPHAQVRASYYWQGAVQVREQQTDANGSVVWKDLPPVQVITWGEGIRAGVIPPAGSSMTAPLPVPTPRGSVQYRFTITNPTPGEKIYGYLRAAVEMSFDDEAMAGDGQQTSLSASVTCGAPFTLRLYTLSSPPRTVYLKQMYAPYLDTDADVEMPLTLREGATIRGRFVARDGKPVPGVSYAQVALVRAADHGIPGTDMLEHDWSLKVPEFVSIPEQIQRNLRTKIHPDGTFSLDVITTGTYRVLPDLYLDASGTPPAFQFEVHPGVNEVTIPLPDPLATVPGGTVVSWITPNMPAIPRQLAVAAYGSATPVYGPKALLLAFWYRPRPDQLVLWDRATGTERRREFSLRSVSVDVIDSQGKPVEIGNAVLAPLLPGTSSMQQQYSDNSYRNIADTRFRYPFPYDTTPLPVPMMPEFTVTRIPSSSQESSVELWTGTSYVFTGIRPAQMVDIPADVTTPITVRLATDISESGDGQSRNLRLIFPPIDREKTGKLSSHTALACYDAPWPRGEHVPLWGMRNREQWVQAPRTTRTMSLQWLGVGVMRNIPLPEFCQGEREPVITLPSWSPGASISGKIVLSNGRPYANRRLVIAVPGMGDSSCNLQIKTDAQGKFAARGLLPETICLWLEDLRMGWSLDIPEKGLTNVVLRATSVPVNVQLPFLGDHSQVWWFPDGGKGQRLPVRWSECAVADLQTGPGWLWQIDESNGQGFYTQCSLQRGYNSFDRRVERPQARPSLGMIFPLDPAAGLPGTIRLIGEGARAGITIYIRQPEWSAIPPLGIITGQVEVVPPGVYTLSVSTDRGVVESRITVTDNGTVAYLSFPPVKETPATNNDEE